MNVNDLSPDELRAIAAAAIAYIESPYTDCRSYYPFQKFIQTYKEIKEAHDGKKD